MTEAERMYAIKEAARKIVEAVQGENLTFISSAVLRKMDIAEAKGDGKAMIDLNARLRERPEDVVRIIEVVLESMY